MSALAPDVLPDRPLRRALFVDRDGTVNVDLHYLKEAERLEVFRGVGSGLRLAHAHGFLVVCVTNQSGIERGLYSPEDVGRIHARLNERLASEQAHIDAFYYCPHAPESNCDCRKPKTRLFEDARRDWNLDLASSAIVGDRALDVEAGRRLGLLTALVPPRHVTGRVAEEVAAAETAPDLVAPSFESAVLRILARG